MIDRASQIQRVNPLDDPDWDEKLAAIPCASFFHGLAWARVLRETYEFRPVYFVADDELSSHRSILPVAEINSWLTGRRGVSLPFSDECEPLSTDGATSRRLVTSVQDYARSRLWKHWELRGAGALLDGERPSATYYGHKVDLRHPAPVLFTGFESSVRRAIRKATQSDLQVEFSRGIEAARAFHGLLCKTRKRHGLPPQPLRFFETIHRHVLATNQGCVVLARLHDVPVAGAVFFHFGRTALYKYGASDDAFQHLRPNNLVMWRAIEWHARSGFETLDLGRTSCGNDGLRRFKLGWGAQERTIHYARYHGRTGALLGAKDRSSGWPNEIFKILPTSLSRLIGSAAYRHVG